MSQETRSTNNDGPKVDKLEGPGPYLAVVRNHLDNEYMGALEVELLKTSSEGNLPEATGNIIPVSYLSPFYGVTPFKALSENEGFDYTQKSYGFWAVPPDIGTRVMVIFAEGNRGAGFWIGCVQDRYMNFMVPGNASTTYNDEDNTKSKPVGEYNKAVEEGAGNDPTQYVKPCNMDQCAILDRAGIAEDTIRGTTSSSARRDIPSMVFGINTPGPLDRRSGKPKVKTGDQFNQTEIPSSRLGGTSIVMDDGDPSMFRKGPAGGEKAVPSEYASLADGGDPSIPHNELFRIRTRTGHQILLHNSEDLIYIAHGSGDSWIEMTANGKIDIYSKDSINIRTETDFNFQADRDINIRAGRDINLTAGNQMLTGTGANWEVKVGADGKLTCAGTSNIKSAHHFETAAKIDMNGPAAAEAGTPAPPAREPQHEPWVGHENKNPTEYTPEKTNMAEEENKTKAKEKKDGSTAESKEKAASDTFAKCPPMEKSEKEKAAEEKQTKANDGNVSDGTRSPNAKVVNSGFGTAQGGEFDTTNDNNGFGNSAFGEFGPPTNPRKPTGSATVVNPVDEFAGGNRGGEFNTTDRFGGNDQI